MLTQVSALYGGGLTRNTMQHTDRNMHTELYQEQGRKQGNKTQTPKTGKIVTHTMQKLAF